MRSRKLFLLSFFLVITAVGTCLSAAGSGPFIGTDRDLANIVWGNPETIYMSPPPNANHFNYPIPVGMGARPLGMGEAFTAIADELSAVWWNPAGLIQMDKNEVHWMSGDVHTDFPYTGFLSASYILENRMVFAVSYMRPWHPTGRYPSVLGGAYDFPSWSGASGVVNIPAVPGASIPFESITDTAVQDFLKGAYRNYINPAFQENALAFSYATPLNADRTLSFGINVKYYYEDEEYKAYGDDYKLSEVTGWGADVGFLYRQPLSGLGREVSFGLNIRDLAGQVRFDEAREITLAPITTLGFGWKTLDPFTHSKLNLAMDYSYINDPSFESSNNQRLNIGGEMWFFKDRVGPRVGYSMFLNREKSRPTLGISFKYLVGLDYAYHFPAQNDDATHWFSLTFRWGGPKQDIPLPDVFVTVDPPIFAPRQGETATFNLSVESKNGVDRWTLNIIDRNSMVVKTYQDRGNPPSQIIWGGEDNNYRVLPDGEYTFLFTATDHKGYSSSTPVQTLKLYTPPAPVKDTGSVDALRRLIRNQEEKEEQIDDKDQEYTNAELQKLLEKISTNRELPPMSEAPEVPATVTPLAQAKADAGSFSYPRVNAAAFPKTVISTDPDGKKSLVVEFASVQDQPRYILNDIADVVRVSAKDVGNTVARYDVTAKYGNRQLRVVSDNAAALSMARGFITRDQYLEAARVTLDGELIKPSYR